LKCLPESLLTSAGEVQGREAQQGSGGVQERAGEVQERCRRGAGEVQERRFVSYNIIHVHTISYHAIRRKRSPRRLNKFTSFKREKLQKLPNRAKSGCLFPQPSKPCSWKRKRPSMNNDEHK
jgi:hypothetical protein